MKISNLIESKVNKHRQGIKIYWWRPDGSGKRNFGDEVTPVIIEKIWRTRCLWTRLADSEMVGAGSIIDIVNKYNPKGHLVNVWGSGLIEDGPDINNRDIKFHLVRGPLTASRIPNNTSIPIGDPGLLVSRVFPRSDTKTHKVGFVLHMKDIESSEVQQLTDRCLIISPYQTPEKVAKDITSCELIFSSSLHGLIFADSFGVPNFRVKHNDLEGGDYKFEDYYQSTNRNPQNFSFSDILRVIKSDARVEEIINNYKPIMNLVKMQDVIEGSFPYHDRSLQKVSGE